MWRGLNYKKIFWRDISVPLEESLKWKTPSEKIQQIVGLFEAEVGLKQQALNSAQMSYA